jgi:hypothetical protein
MKFFNTAGPVKPEKNYTIDLLKRLNLEEVLMLIEQEKYFILHAPRQTGKTSSLFALRDYLNNEGKYYCVYVNVESGQANRNNIDDAIKTILEALDNQIYGHEFYDIFEKLYLKYNSIPGTAMLEKVLTRFCLEIKIPMVLLIDEIDSLVGDTLISVLRQLRSGYSSRPKGFPQTIILCGVRDVKDYRIYSPKGKEIITGGSAFNIKAESIRLGNFIQKDIKELYIQHTEDTGQVFEDDIFDYVWKLTDGQPWLVNALAYESCFKIEKNRSKPITREIIEKAKENLIINRVTHLDVLIDKLNEERVQKIIEPVLSGSIVENLNPDDVSYVIDMGLVKEQKGGLVVSNAIYKEVIPRELTWTKQISLNEQTEWYVENGKLQMKKLLKNFQNFYRQNSDIWLEKFAYKEAGPHLLLMAFLQRILNGGGKINREYGLGLMRIDIYVEYNDDKFCLELKVLRDESTCEKGLKQLQKYVDTAGANEGHLIIFNRFKNVSWDEKIYCNQIDDKITVWGC